MIPLIDLTSLFAPASAARDATDRAIMAAATGAGFMTITAAPGLLPTDSPARAALLRVFALPEAQRARLLRRTFAPANPSVYRGWFPLQNGVGSYKEGIDMGPDIANPLRAEADPAGDPLREPTPVPAEAALPGWRAAAAAYYRNMERLGGLMMQSLARGLGLPERFFDAPFADGISTLRLIHYPPRPRDSFGDLPEAALWVEHDGERRYLLGGAHVDSGFVTLLAQDGVAGLQAEDSAGRWVDVPPAEATLAVNFGGLLERWTGGRIRATRHRVIGLGRPRHSIPFFYEPAADAVIRTLPLPDAPEVAPFRYGDHLWAAMLRFPEFRGLEGARAPRGVHA
jgi:isopenicillin N synthase-like dioxygenase